MPELTVKDLLELVVFAKQHGCWLLVAGCWLLVAGCACGGSYPTLVPDAHFQRGLVWVRSGGIYQVLVRKPLV
jgi:hypothetical protein